MTSVPDSLQEIAGRVEQRLREVLEPEIDRWRRFDADLGEPLAEIPRLVLGGGKRLRPAFCHWGYVAAGGNHADDIVVDAGAAFELMHAFALFHDDVMDDAASRRGLPTTHTLFSARHREEAWVGDGRRFGDGIAILIGDLAFVIADRLMSPVNRVAWGVWDELRIELNIGQLLDILGSVQNDRRREKAERICRYKSGKYTIERPLHLGAAMAAPEQLDELGPWLSRYGLPLGDAFQMRDDVMGVFGDPTITGKPVGGDLREAKPTPLLARAVAAASPAQATVLAMVGRVEMTDADVACVQEVIIATGALADLERSIDALVGQAIDAITDAPVVASARQALLDLAEYVSRRQQ